MFRTGSAIIDAESAFRREARASRRAAVRRVLRRGADGAHLPVFDSPRAGTGLARISEIPIESITGTLEPSRAAQFDGAFRPVQGTLRPRWQRIWMAEDRGAVLPPISVVPVECGYAVRDGHHRVSVARARGAGWIDAIVV